MKKRSLKFKLIVGSVLAAIIPLTVVGIFSITQSSKALVAAAKGQALQVAGDLAAMTEMAVAQEVKLAKGMALDPMVVNAAGKVLEEGMDSAGSELEALDGFFVKVYEQIGSDYDLFFVTNAEGLSIHYIIT